MLVSEVKQEILGDRVYPLAYLWGEIKELCVELWHARKKGVLEEWMDSLYAAQVIIHQITGWDFHLRGVSPKVEVFLRRNAFLKRMFEEKGATFSTEYTTCGNNIRKRSKIRKIFLNAGIHISDQDLRRWEKWIGGYED